MPPATASHSSAPSTDDNPNNTKQRFRLRWHWGLTPVVAIGCALTANMILINNASTLSLDSISDDPYGESAQFDQQRQATQNFAELGLHISTERLNHQVFAILSSTSPRTSFEHLQQLSLRWYRADDSNLDFTQTWEQPEQPLPISLPKQGWWWVTLTGTYQAKEIRYRTHIRF